MLLNLPNCFRSWYMFGFSPEATLWLSGSALSVISSQGRREHGPWWHCSHHFGHRAAETRTLSL